MSAHRVTRLDATGALSSSATFRGFPATIASQGRSGAFVILVDDFSGRYRLERWAPGDSGRPHVALPATEPRPPETIVFTAMAVATDGTIAPAQDINEYRIQVVGACRGGARCASSGRGTSRPAAGRRSRPQAAHRHRRSAVRRRGGTVGAHDARGPCGHRLRCLQRWWCLPRRGAPQWSRCCVRVRRFVARRCFRDRRGLPRRAHLSSVLTRAGRRAGPTPQPAIRATVRCRPQPQAAC